MEMIILANLTHNQGSLTFLHTDIYSQTYTFINQNSTLLFHPCVCNFSLLMQQFRVYVHILYTKVITHQQTKPNIKNVPTPQKIKLMMIFFHKTFIHSFSASKSVIQKWKPEKHIAQMREKTFLKSKSLYLLKKNKLQTINPFKSYIFLPNHANVKTNVINI